ncbi:MAG: tRNA glutamyl-Q(34) synthetase GluQRS [Akkermansia sp.]|nr:tRNA glutamyl-Q(34) synthetase GluQRS [Akkermansia sp.]MBQ2869076.1 tRNA glutamyl-Q(34) synthetase GluQRS [Akkermansia sp.]
MPPDRVVVTRFAPSPSGPLHVGHLLAALQARRLADAHGGRCLLRVEDIDQRAQHPEYLQLMYEDLRWLDLEFDGEVMVQTQRFDRYRAVLEQLRCAGLLYPCFCTRTEIRNQVAEMGRAPHATLGYLYPGTCRQLPPDQVAEKLAAGVPHTWRLDMQRVQDLIGCPTWHDLRRGTQRCVPTAYGDVVLARKDFPASYHLAVVVDDAAQGVTHVTRGADLFDSTHIHRALQGVLGLPVPQYCHHALLRDNTGKRLAKRDGARSIASLRQAGFTPQQVLDSLRTALQRGGIWRV